MSLLDTVEPDFVWHKPKSGDPDGDIVEEKLYREATVESLLAENRKQVLMEVTELCNWRGNIHESELRRMAEGEKE